MIIINSDDFGYSPQVNLATYRAFQENLISSTTTLVNFEIGLADAVAYVTSGKIDPKAIGIHLNLTEGTPLTEKMKGNDRFCINGEFIGSRASSLFYLDHSSHECVYNELEAQVGKFIEAFGNLPSHIDSHHHIHTEWAIMKCTLNVARKFGIKSIRLTRNLGEISDVKRRVYKMILNTYLKIIGLKVTDKFGSIEDLINSGIDPKLDYEIMVHALINEKDARIVDLDQRNLKNKLEILFQSPKWEITNYSVYRNQR